MRKQGVVFLTLFALSGDNLARLYADTVVVNIGTFWLSMLKIIWINRNVHWRYKSIPIRLNCNLPMARTCYWSVVCLFCDCSMLVLFRNFDLPLYNSHRGKRFKTTTVSKWSATVYPCSTIHSASVQVLLVLVYLCLSKHRHMEQTKNMQKG